MLVGKSKLSFKTCLKDPLLPSRPLGEGRGLRVGQASGTFCQQGQRGHGLRRWEARPLPLKGNADVLANSARLPPVARPDQVLDSRWGTGTFEPAVLPPG